MWIITNRTIHRTRLTTKFYIKITLITSNTRRRLLILTNLAAYLVAVDAFLLINVIIVRTSTFNTINLVS